MRGLKMECCVLEALHSYDQNSISQSSQPRAVLQHRGPRIPGIFERRHSVSLVQWSLEVEELLKFSYLPGSWGSWTLTSLGCVHLGNQIDGTEFILLIKFSESDAPMSPFSIICCTGQVIWSANESRSCWNHKLLKFRIGLLTIPLDSNLSNNRSIIYLLESKTIFL